MLAAPSKKPRIAYPRIAIQPAANNAKNSLIANWRSHQEHMHKCQKINLKPFQNQKFKGIGSRFKMLNSRSNICFNSHSWLQSLQSMGKFNINKNGKRTMSFSNRDNKFVGFSCHLTAPVKIDNFLDLMLATKFTESEDKGDENFVVFVEKNTNINFVRNTKKYINNCDFFEQMLEFVNKKKFIFEL